LLKGTPSSLGPRPDSTLLAAVERQQEGGATGALDLQEGIGGDQGCDRWPEHMRLLYVATGELVRGRCRATNLCRYCQRLYVRETVEMLTLDAMEYAPTLWVVLTARNHLTRAQLRDHLRELRRTLRLRWGLLEWFVQVEFQRRGALHVNLLVKGVAAEDAEQFGGVAVARWCSLPGVDALPVAQWLEAIDSGVGVVRYISKVLAHGLKAEQAPPIGWKGHRTSQTRGYLVRPAAVMREEAKRSLRLKQLVRHGRTVAEAELELGAAGEWRLWRVSSAPLLPGRFERVHELAGAGQGTALPQARVDPSPAPRQPLDQVVGQPGKLASAAAARPDAVAVRPREEAVHLLL
jgi:hypothetical protein